ncbi:L-serine ammonia-lyase [Brevibacterium jeotgali]|uniref:L-serine dehydratase n=1 Tax=Brevibacterium jeotgali TaxID=1262550 RepID=A0A2H1L3W9_9MICO|nr:L-serine ammonia-lyase [Brevibacterium jeotgali]TWC01813.1 L-serine dehydratase [Brevibacterium jeotgali]SMY11559.1 L-serine dehydratase [Brevibacterium jeotgali]
MPISVFDLFTVGIGPSSSHTVGPMRAAASFVDLVGDRRDDVAALEVDVYGSLAATGRGHGTFDAILLGLEGCRPDAVLPDEVDERTARIAETGVVRFGDRVRIPFAVADMRQRPLTVLERHTNALELRARSATGEELAHEIYYSVGGGFVVTQSDEEATVLGAEAGESAREPATPHDFRTGDRLLEIANREGLEIWQVMLANELGAGRTEQEVREGLLHIAKVMEECAANSIDRSGHLPGGLSVRRRAHDWHIRLKEEDPDRDPRYYQEWVNLIALAVNEENASGGRVVTAPTNGAAGIIPAVLHYALNYVDWVRDGGDAARDEATVRFLLTAAAIGVLYKEGASISGAEVGCQGEVGSASSMAAGGLAEVLGGSVEQVENAAEIAMEHNLGLTCDPIAGLVQVPCIERNAIGAGKSINAAKMAMWGDGEHFVSLDEAIATMKATGADMSDKYKETALGGLAVNVVEC